MFAVWRFDEIEIYVKIIWLNPSTQFFCIKKTFILPFLILLFSENSYYIFLYMCKTQPEMKSIKMFLWALSFTNFMYIFKKHILEGKKSKFDFAPILLKSTGFRKNACHPFMICRQYMRHTFGCRISFRNSRWLSILPLWTQNRLYSVFRSLLATHSERCVWRRANLLHIVDLLCYFSCFFLEV